MNTLEIQFLDTNKELYNQNTNYQSDSGFDIFTPDNHVIPGKAISYKIPLGICVHLFGSGSYLYARSSTGSKTPLRLSNNVGIIDEGYTGQLYAFVDNISNDDYIINKGDRLFQLCAPNLKPLYIRYVDKLTTTERGSNGFGSSGK